MHPLRILCLAGFMPSLLLVPFAQAQPAAIPAGPALPEIRQLILEVLDHQKQLDKVRENYTYSSLLTIQEMDANGQVKKTETEEIEDFFVNGHLIGRTVKKDGQPLNEHEQKKETERVTKLAEKAEKTPRDQPLEGQRISVSRLLEIMDVRNPRRETFHGRSSIVFDFIGRKDATTHGIAEDASKKLQGTVWIDEADRQVVHLEVIFNDNFHVAGGLLSTIEKGSNFHFDQALVNGEIWLPTGGEGTVQARVLLVKGIRQHYTERDFDYQRFRVETRQSKDAKVVPEKKQ
ncbi:MAG: hypothetical protein ABSA48_11420 [Terracidiphilus sp.]|jgi:hypothetical protein